MFVTALGSIPAYAQYQYLFGYKGGEANSLVINEGSTSLTSESQFTSGVMNQSCGALPA